MVRGNCTGRDGMPVFVPMAVGIEVETAMFPLPIGGEDRLQVEERDVVPLRRVLGDAIEHERRAVAAAVNCGTVGVHRQQQVRAH